MQGVAPSRKTVQDVLHGQAATGHAATVPLGACLRLGLIDGLRQMPTIHVSEDEKHVLRIIYEWCYGGRSQLIGDPPEPVPKTRRVVPSPWLRAEIKHSVKDVSAVLRLLFDKHLIEHDAARLLSTTDADRNSAWQLSDGRTLRITTTASVEEIPGLATHGQHTRCRKGRVYRRRILIDGVEVDASISQFLPPADWTLRLTTEGVEATESFLSSGENGKGATRSRRHQSDSGGKLKADVKRTIVLEFLEKCGGWDGTLIGLSAELKRKKTLSISASTLSRYLRGTKYDRKGKPRRAPKGKAQREAVSDDLGPADLSDHDAWTIPDDPTESIS